MNSTKNYTYCYGLTPSYCFQEAVQRLENSRCDVAILRSITKSNLPSIIPPVKQNLFLRDSVVVQKWGYIIANTHHDWICQQEINIAQ